MESEYQVISPLSGSILLQGPASCRYRRETELALLDADYIVKLHGKKLTKTEIRKEANGK